MSPQHEHSAVLAAFKLIALAMLLGAIGGLVYYGLELREDGTAEGTEVTDETVETEATEAKEEEESISYENETLDVTFEVPAEWQTISENQELGLFGDEEVQIDEEGNVMFTCETHTSLAVILGDAGTEFLTADDNGDCETLGRGGYWGDRADGVTSSEALEAWCNELVDGVCQIRKNEKGVTYAHAHYDSVESWGTVIEDVDEYYFFHEGHDWDGIIISDEFFVQAGVTDLDDDFLRLVESLEFQQ